MEYGAALREMWVACGNLGDDCLDGFRLASDEERRAAAMLVLNGANSYDVAMGFASRQDTTRPAAVDPWIWRYARQLQALANQRPPMRSSSGLRLSGGWRCCRPATRFGFSRSCTWSA